MVNNANVMLRQASGANPPGLRDDSLLVGFPLIPASHNPTACSALEALRIDEILSRLTLCCVHLLNPSNCTPPPKPTRHLEEEDDVPFTFSSWAASKNYGHLVPPRKKHYLPP